MRYHLNTAARKQVDPCFPAGHRLASARVYHGKGIISTELDEQTVSGGAPATRQRPWSRPGARQFHRDFVPLPPRTHPGGRGGGSNRRPESILAGRRKGAPHSGGHPAFFAVGGLVCGIVEFCDFNEDFLEGAEAWTQVLTGMRTVSAHRGHDQTGHSGPGTGAAEGVLTQWNP